MKDILEKIDEATNKIKSAADHSFSMIFICACCYVGCLYLGDIKAEAEKTNTLLKIMVEQSMKRDSVNTPNNNNAVMPKKKQ